MCKDAGPFIVLFCLFLTRWSLTGFHGDFWVFAQHPPHQQSPPRNRLSGGNSRLSAFDNSRFYGTKIYSAMKSGFMPFSSTMQNLLFKWKHTEEESKGRASCMPHFCLFLFFFSFFSFTHLCFFFSFSFLWGWACCWGPGSEQSFWHVLKGCSTLMMRSSFLPNSGAKGRDKKRNFHQPPPEFIPWGTLLSLPVSFRSLATPSGQFKITPPPQTHTYTLPSFCKKETHFKVLLPNLDRILKPQTLKNR